MKKFFKILSINILILIIGCFVLDFVIWGFENYSMYKNKEKYIGVWPIPYHPGVKIFNVDFKYFPNPDENWGRMPEGLNYKKKPIALFGCSYVYGYNLQNEQTFSYKLSHKAKRPVYNRAVMGWGIQHMLYQANDPLLYKQVPEPEYVIFVSMFDHLRRLYARNFSSGHLLNEERYLRYKEVDGQLIQKTGVKVNSIPSVFKELMDRSYITSKMYDIYENNFLIKEANYENYSEFLIKHFVQSKEKMQEYWKNTKFVILLYNKMYNEDDLKNRLEKNGFIVIDLQDLTQTDLTTDEFKLKNDPHPNEKAWDLITPKIIEELKL